MLVASAHPVGVNCSAVDAVMTHSQAHGASRLVLLAIARHLNAETDEAWPSNETIRRLSGVGDASAVRKAVRRLIELGELERDVQDSPAGTNIFRLPKMDEWVTRTPELPSVSLVERGRGTSSTQGDRHGSSEVPGPSPGPDDYERLVQELSYEFADLLIDAGRKNPRYRSDAASREWLYGIEKILFEHANRGLDHIYDVLVHAAEADLCDGTSITRPIELASLWRDAEESLGASQEETARAATTMPGSAGGITVPPGLAEVSSELAEAFAGLGANQ